MNPLKSSILTAALALVTLTSANAQIYINEIFFNPGGTDAPNEFIELRGTPSLTVSTGTYLLFLEGDNGGSSTVGARPGDIQGIFDLSGKAFGANGYMALRQFGSSYSVNSSATSYTATSTGWGGLGLNSATAGGDVENISFTAMVISIGTAAAPTWGQQLDSDNNGLLELVSGWSILDSIGVGDTGVSDRLYGAVNFSNAPEGSSVSSNNGLLKYLGWSETEYLARVADSTGNTLADWAVADTGFVSPDTAVASTVNTDESWNLAAGVAIAGTLGSVNPVPEPSSAALLGFGTLALLGLRRLNRKS